MQVIKCDRCKEEAQTVDVTSYKFVNGWWQRRHYIELCDDCNNKFREIMNNFMKTSQLKPTKSRSHN